MKMKHGVPKEARTLAEHILCNLPKGTTEGDALEACAVLVTYYLSQMREPMRRYMTEWAVTNIYECVPEMAKRREHNEET